MIRKTISMDEIIDKMTKTIKKLLKVIWWDRILMIYLNEEIIEVMITGII